MIEFLNQLDTSFFIYLNSLHNDFFDAVFLWVTEKYSWLFLYVIMLSLLMWRYLAVRVQVFPSQGLRAVRLDMNKSCWPWLLLAVIFVSLVVAIGDQVSVHLFKNVFQRLRPSHEPDLAGLIHLPRRQGGLYGFVSGHATTSFALAYFSARIIGLRWYTWVIFVWAAVFSYSRIYIGVHYPGDSLFGALLGLFTGWLLLRVWVSIGNEWFRPLLPANLQTAPETPR